jgi:hypothetical protein
MEVKNMSMKWVFYGVLISATMPTFAEEFSGSARFGLNQYGFYMHMNINGHSLPYMVNGLYPWAYSDRYAGNRGYKQPYPAAYPRFNGDRQQTRYDYQNANGQNLNFIADPRYQKRYAPRYPVAYSPYHY